MPFIRLQEAIALATSIDTAMNRRDEVGMDMLRDLLPELREIIDDVNAALREVDELLFIGLRDEAVALNEPEFPRVAARLNLEDKSAWPEAQAFFAREGIASPPTLDFETLAALESAHAELETLGRPLDRIRRLVLERAPILQRLEVLRRLRDADGTKPVWAETIADHERARLAELPEAVKRAFAARDPATIAELHAELVDPEWTVPVPRDLIKATRGAELWARLRDAVPAAERAVEALEARLAAAESDFAPSVVQAARQARQEWYQESAAVHESQAALAQSPNVATLAKADGLEGRFAALVGRVQPALTWLEQIDAHDAALAGHAHAIVQLESLLSNPPRSAQHEQAWLASVGHLERQLVQQGGLPDQLRTRAAAGAAAVRRRPLVRLAMKGLVAAAVIGTLLAVVFVMRGCRQARQDLEDAISMLEDEHTAANGGAYVSVPQEVMDVASRYKTSSTVKDLVKKITTAVKTESNRRVVVRDAITDQEQRLDEVEKNLEERALNGGMLEPWPDDITQATRAWRKARGQGGLPNNPTTLDDRVKPVRQDEERLIASGRKRQEDVEMKLGQQARNAFQKRLNELSSDIESLPSMADPEAYRQIVAELNKLETAGQQEKPREILKENSVSTLVPGSFLDNLRNVRTQLERRSAGRASTPRGAKP